MPQITDPFFASPPKPPPPPPPPAERARRRLLALIASGVMALTLLTPLASAGSGAPSYWI